MDAFWESLSSWVWILIPLCGMAMVVAIVVIENRAKAARHKNNDANKILAELKAQLATQQQALEKRVANLEVIVTSQTWDVLHDAKLSSEEKKFLSQQIGSELENLKQDLTDARRAEILVSRLK